MNQKSMLYIHCPVCGREVCKSGEGTNTEQNCPKCKSVLSYAVESDTVRIRVVKASDKKRVS